MNTATIMPTIINGTAIAATIKAALPARITQLPHAPHLAVVIVGEHPPSQIYVRNKLKAASLVGIQTTLHTLPENTTQAALATLLTQLSATSAVHGILLQLPLPKHLNARQALDCIAPEKDVDGLSVLNAGRRGLGLPCLLPCTPMGCMRLLQTVVSNFNGLHAVVIGRSDLVGKPMAQLLLAAGCTVTHIHKATINPAQLCAQADIVVAAAGHTGLVQSHWLKSGAVVIDVGINRQNDGTLVGDVDFMAASLKANAITPVPGGVGPMTIACLLENTVSAAENQLNA
jgi:methylenetetrahydrofolate dehydrogenase (NADP+) / methenyltetrahydrofolate cyclohydrolase